MTNQVLNVREFSRFLEEACDHYEKSAPTVHAWTDNCYRRLADLRDVSVFEMGQLLDLRGEDGWEHPNYAANRAYHVAESLNRETVGHAGF